MTVIRSKNERRIVLDFSGGKLSKNKIKQALRALEISIYEHSLEHNIDIIIKNEIKVGMYIIRLWIEGSLFPGKCKLKDFDNMSIDIRENNKSEFINIHRDGRFKNQYWCAHNTNSNFRMKHLVDAIAHCHRLDGLKAFL